MSFIKNKKCQDHWCNENPENIFKKIQKKIKIKYVFIKDFLKIFY